MLKVARRVVFVLIAANSVCPVAAQPAPGRTTRVSVATNGVQGNGTSSWPSVSADGRFVVFASSAASLVPEDTNGVDDVFVRDRATGTTTRVSVASDGTQANGPSSSGLTTISGDGRFVAFSSSATNLVPGDTNGVRDVFVHDRSTGATTRVSIATDGTQGDGVAYLGGISADGRVIAFSSFATNIVLGDTNAQRDVFVHDRITAETSRVSIATGGTQADSSSSISSLSSDGRFVVFLSYASNLAPFDANGTDDVFVHDRTTGVTSPVSIAVDGALGNARSYDPAVSADGRYVAFSSQASNLVAGDTNSQWDTFVRDRVTGVTTKASVATGGEQGNANSSLPAISADGRWITFCSFATNMVAGNTDQIGDIFLHDRVLGVTTQQSVSTDGSPGNGNSIYSAVSANGRFVVYSSHSSNYVVGDSNGYEDVFVRDRLTTADVDVTGDLKSDIVWHHAGRGEVWLWAMDGASSTAQTHVRTVGEPGWEIRGQGDQNGDGKADILWRNSSTGMLYLWTMNGSTVEAETYVATVEPAYDIVGTGDYNGDGKSDILWRHLANGEVWVWLMNGVTPLSQTYIDTVDPAYVVQGSGDLNGDGKADLVWRHATGGDVWVWLMNGATPTVAYVDTVAELDYRIVGVADHTGDGKADILWHHATRGEVWLWPMNGTTRVSQTYVDAVPDTGYQIVGSGDYDGDGKADILWHHASRGEVWVWLMNGAAKLSETYVATVPETGYQIVKVK